ncbi:FMN-binding negative transcriptional regulator [Winogradskyella sp. UBA3174]|uniref:FMN-binding negative transcriptional regulator n=1 Tax=Winogradskyella sp. UBA3174 TaxID=1947785 RepID=UPI0026001172|nr:FMN-binding negative transcriptional regulator [Winogradskyella sp. UBA3174]|tara:strand:+ start:11013 stop:11603 length:591 start_codon:yes stop_codon:yes gene_type:complete
MNYPPKKHQDNDINHMIDVIKTYPLATVISVKDNLPLITHLPLVYEDGKLIGHIDIYNPQGTLLKDDNDVTIIFAGPECYISPSIYSTTQLPTWNYIKVHLIGKVKAIKSKAALKQSLITMTEFLETPDHKYILEPDNPRLDKNLDYIEMFEIEITNWEGKFKLSQDKKPKDIKAAREELVRANQESIRLFLDKVF